MSYDLIEEVREKSVSLDRAISQLMPRGKERAQTERDYRVALRQKILTERSKGTPVTIISDVCRGDPEIADLRLKKDYAAVAYDTLIDAINGCKLQIRILDAQIEREWGRSGAQ